MSIDFLNPNLFWLLALAAVPLLLHLFARTRPPVYRFSSVEFLRKIVKKTMRLKKPQDILLLILRTLAILALIGAFLRPLLFSQEKLSGLFQEKSLVAIVDASASMAYVEGAQTRFAKACAETGELLSGLSGGDQANIVWLKAEPESVFPDELGSNLGFLREQLRRASVTSERGSLEKAFALAVELLEEAEGKREICVVSDFQRSAWENFRPAVPDGVDLIHVRIGSGDAPNLAVTGLSFEPARPVVGEEMAIHAEIRNFSPQDRETTVFSEVGESRRSQNQVIPAGESATAIFRHALTAAGTTPIRISVAEDAFPGDDQRMLAARVRPFLRIAVVSGDEPDTARMWARAAQSLGWAVPEWATAGDLADRGADEFDAVFLAGTATPPEIDFPAAVKVVYLPGSGDETGPAGFDPVKARLENSNGPPFRLRVADENASLFDLFRGGEHGTVAGLAGTKRMLLSAAPSGRSLLAYEDGAPALVQGGPNRYLWLAPLSDESGNLAGRVEFLPLFAELLLSDRLTGSANLNAVDYEPGESIFWEPDEPVSTDNTRLTDAEGNELEFSSTGGAFQAGPLSRPGLYRWTVNLRQEGVSVVNFPESESNLESLTIGETQDSASVAVRGGRDVRYLRDGMKLWPWLIAAAIGLFVIEGGVTLWAARTP